jgi:hypothetical protein
MTRALDDAYLQLHSQGCATPSDLGRKIMVDRIVAAVDAGERDPERLRKIAVNAVDGRYSDG